MIAKRAGWIGMILALIAGIVLTVLGRPVGAIVLTVTAGVAIINGLWLEGVLITLLQPGRARVSRGAVALLIARFVVWGLLFAFLYVLRRRFELWVVAVGLGCFLVALVLAGLKSGGETTGEG